MYKVYFLNFIELQPTQKSNFDITIRRVCAFLYAADEGDGRKKDSRFFRKSKNNWKKLLAEP